MNQSRAGSDPGPHLDPVKSAAVLRAYVLSATKDRLGRDMSMQARFAALDALEVIDRELATANGDA